MSSTLKYILIDDEILGLKYLKLLCEGIKGIEIEKAYVDPELFLEDLKSNKIDFDFCILDIEMPKINGLQIAEYLKNKPFIFATAYKEYATNAFDLDAVDYIQKPIKIERLQQAINKIKNFIQQDNFADKTVQLNSDKGKIILQFDQIVYITTSSLESRDKVILMKDLSEITLKNITLDNLRDLLPEKYFVRINKREIVNINNIQYYQSENITLNILSKEEKEIILTLSEVYKPDFISKISI